MSYEEKKYMYWSINCIYYNNYSKLDALFKKAREKNTRQ